LARDLIRLSGYELDQDIEIKFTGMRPGEKLFEEIAVDDENVDKTKHPKIYVGRFRPQALAEVERGLAELHRLSDGHDAAAIKAAFRRIVPEYAVAVDDVVVVTPPPPPPPSPPVDAPAVDDRASRPSSEVVLAN